MTDQLRYRDWENKGYVGKEPDRFYTVISKMGETIAIIPGEQIERESNASFICEAVNNHDRLLSENRALRDAIAYAFKHYISDEAARAEVNAFFNGYTKAALGGK